MPTIDYRTRYSYRKGCVEAFHVHLVFVTKYRRDVLTPPICVDLRDSFAETCRRHHASLRNFGAGHPDPDAASANSSAGNQGVADQPPNANHIHLIIRYPGTLSIPLLVRDLKRLSYAAVWSKYPSIKASYVSLKELVHARRSTTTLWSPSYFAESVGRSSLQRARDYADQQEDQTPKSLRKRPYRSSRYYSPKSRPDPRNAPSFF
jgi:putative transposase